MKKIILSSILFALTFSVNSQIKAITENGDEVILYNDKTWKFINDSLDFAKEIIVNETLFKKGEKSTFLVKSNKIKMGVWINPKKWSFKKNPNSDDAEYEFEFRDGDLYGMIITEKIQIPVEAIKNIALENARGVAPDIQSIKEEYRTVNGKKVLMMQMSGTMQGIKFSYYSYYFSNDNGVVQLITYTSDNLLNSYLKDIEKFLNGFVTID
tara:strand:- start:415 stop:1047 length:633 start_codon:yes stop_codon:yes gene_type:complete